MWTDLQLIQVPGWEFSWLRHGFTTRRGGATSVYGRTGELNLGLTAEDDADVVQANRLRVVRALNGDMGLGMATVRQVHQTGVLRVRRSGPAGDGDGLVTDTPGLVIGVQAADCVPVLLADVRLRVVGALHAGWRGTVARMAETGVERMKEEFGCRPEDLVAAVGPSIGSCCYGVGEEVRTRFRQEFAYADALFSGDRLDLWESNRRQLGSAGVSRVSVVGECTACSRIEGLPKYFSHRADAGRSGRGMGVIGVVVDG